MAESPKLDLDIDSFVPIGDHTTFNQVLGATPQKQFTRESKLGSTVD